jgi:hypothetical protein
MELVLCANCEALQRRVHDLQIENERLRRQLDAALRAGKRQAGPVAKGEPKANPRKPGRKPGKDYGTKAHRRLLDRPDGGRAVMSSTIVSIWTDRAADAQRLNLRQNCSEVDGASARAADCYRQRGVGGPESSRMASTMLGGFVKTEAMAHGIQSGLRFLSLIVGGVGLLVTALLVGARLQDRLESAMGPACRRSFHKYRREES